VETTLTQFNPQDLEVLTRSTSNTAELKSKLNFQKETGFGQPFGSFQKTMLTEHGLHLGKLILLNLEEMIALEQQEEVNHLEQHFIGDQITCMMHMRKLPKVTNIQSLLETISIFTALIGALMVSNQPLMESRL